MYDLKWIREDPKAFDTALAKRGLAPESPAILKLDEERRALIQNLQDAQTKRNAASKEIGKAKASGDEAAAQKLMDEVAQAKAVIQSGEEEEREIDKKLRDALSTLPNAPLDDVPEGEDENANVEVRSWGDKLSFSYQPKQHFEIGEALGLMDFETAAKLSGARFVVLKGALARMERAIAAFMLDIHTAPAKDGLGGYTEMLPPTLVRDEVLFGTGQLPKFAEDLFVTRDDYWLIPTAEVPLTNMVRESIVEEEELPMRLTAWTPCFRAEAGSAGRDTRGMIRQHQFSKVELVSITTEDQSLAELERMTGSAEEVLKRLELPYRTVILCIGDMGFGARKTYDIEVWLPGQDMYREISSCSVCGDFQARRMNARYRSKDDTKDIRFVHTLNGSGLAVGRTMIAIIENYQNEDGSITVPQALRPYMGGLEKIAAG
ncbi:MAG: serine--tRNA ligase [Methyloceanibacter sp.]